MTSKSLALNVLAPLLLLLASSGARAEDPPQEPTAAPAATSDNAPPPVTDTPPGDVGPGTNSVRRSPYMNLLGDGKVTNPLLDNGLGRSALSLSGYFWGDMGYMITKNEQPGLYDQKAEYMQGRVVVRTEYTRILVGDLFATARAEIIAFENEYTKSTYEAHTLDAYVMVGQKKWDLQWGRFLPWEVYYRGLGIDLYTPEESGALGSLPPIYNVNFGWSRFNEPGQLALHFFPVKGLGIEVSGVYGQEGTSGINYNGVRPVIDWKLGGLELVVGGEYFKQSSQRSEFKVSQTQYGGGGRLQYTMPFLTAGVEGAYAHSEKINANEEKDGAQTFDRYSVGGWIDVYLFNDVLSLGLHHTADSRLNNDEPTQLQGYLALMHRLPVRGLSVKLVYGVARGVVDDATADAQFDNSMQSFRVRLQYLFQ
jgi:hypothetical protein